MKRRIFVNQILSPPHHKGLWIFIVFIVRPEKVRKMWAAVLCGFVPGRRDTSGTSSRTTVTKARNSSSSPGSIARPAAAAARGRYRFDVEGGTAGAGVTIKKTMSSGNGSGGGGRDNPAFPKVE